MRRNNTALFYFFIPILTACTFFSFSVISTAYTLTEGMQGRTVTALQKDLKALGYFNISPTGYYGDVTVAAVKKFQANKGLTQDGMAGEDTLSYIDRLLGRHRDILLKEGIRGNNVTALQSDLKALGFITISPTGYYGDVTAAAVKRFQARYGLSQDGEAGSETLAVIDRLLGRIRTVPPASSSASPSAVSISRGGDDIYDYMPPWFDKVENIFARGDSAKVYDIKTGLSFNIKRTYGYNHADCETLTSQDTAIMKKIYGGQWSWTRRAVIIIVDGRKIAGSMAGMPHAGADSQPGEAYVTWRSGGYGAGDNLDDVKNNDMNGHFDIHFYGSRTHGTNRVDSGHQEMVREAAEWAVDKY